MAAPVLSIVIPIHNEAGFLPGALAELRDELAAIPVGLSVLLVENGSTDDTAAVAGRLIAGDDRFSLMSVPEADYGGAMRAGFLAVSGDWVVLFDIDYFSGAFLEAVLAEPAADLVLASKRAAGSEDTRAPLRRLATAVFGWLLKVVLGSTVSDTHGIKAVRRSVVREIGPLVVSRQDLFDTEMVLRAERAGHRIVELPVRVEERRPARSSFLKRVPRTLRGIWRLRRILRGQSRSD